MWILAQSTETHVFAPVQCFDNVKTGVPGFNNTYCIGNVVIMSAAFINVVLLITLFVWHLREQGK